MTTIEWTSSKVPLKDMPEIRRRLLAGESRNKIGAEFGVSGRWISSLMVRWLDATGEQIYPGLTRRIRSERGRNARAAFKAMLRDREREIALGRRHREQLADREARLAPPTRTLALSPSERDRRRRTAGYERGCF